MSYPYWDHSAMWDAIVPNPKNTETLDRLKFLARCDVEKRKNDTKQTCQYSFV